MIQVYARLGPKMTLNYQVIMESYSFPNEVVGYLIPAVKSSIYLMEKPAR